MKLKRKLKRGRKRRPDIVRIIYDDETYVFRNGIAEVPGVYSRGEPVLINIKNFKEMVASLAAKGDVDD